MKTPQPTALDDRPMPVQAKLAAAWTGVMFLYVYGDILNFFTPGVVRNILDGKVFTFSLSQTFSTTALALMAIPIFMIVLSMTFPARANRTTNLVVAAVQIPYAAFHMVGESWVFFFGLAVGLEILLLLLILRYAWTWPRTAPAGRTASTPDLEGLGAQQPV